MYICIYVYMHIYMHICIYFTTLTHTLTYSHTGSVTPTWYMVPSCIHRLVTPTSSRHANMVPSRLHCPVMQTSSRHADMVSHRQFFCHFILASKIYYSAQIEVKSFINNNEIFRISAFILIARKNMCERPQATLMEHLE